LKEEAKKGKEKGKTLHAWVEPPPVKEEKRKKTGGERLIFGKPVMRSH
jgi:hypothetical protein